jgi:hypothetical protein
VSESRLRYVKDEGIEFAAGDAGCDAMAECGCIYTCVFGARIVGWRSSVSGESLTSPINGGYWHSRLRSQAKVGNGLQLT